MSTFTKFVLLAICLFVVPATLLAQADICSSLPHVAPSASSSMPAEVIVQQMKERAAAQAVQDMNRAGWASKMIPLKNALSADELKPLCIFHVEVVPQPTLRLVSVRAPMEILTAVEDAVKRLDAPQAGPRSVELTIHILVATDQDEMLRGVPSSVQPVVDQLRSVLSYKKYYLLDTLLSNTVENHSVTINGAVRGLETAEPGRPPRDTNYSFDSNVGVANAASSTPTVKLSQLRFRLLLGNQVYIYTDVEAPVGKQIVVGKSTYGDRAFILVVSAKVTN